MIRSHFGLQRNPFDPEALTLLPLQQEIFDILRVHAQQGGLCLVLGEPGTGRAGQRLLPRGLEGDKSVYCTPRGCP